MRNLFDAKTQGPRNSGAAKSLLESGYRSVEFRTTLTSILTPEPARLTLDYLCLIEGSC